MLVEVLVGGLYVDGVVYRQESPTVYLLSFLSLLLCYVWTYANGSCCAQLHPLSFIFPSFTALLVSQAAAGSCNANGFKSSIFWHLGLVFMLVHSRLKCSIHMFLVAFIMGTPYGSLTVTC